MVFLWFSYGFPMLSVCLPGRVRYGESTSRIAAGGYAMMPGQKARKKRTRTAPAAAPAAPSPESTAEEAPAGLEMQAPGGYLPLPQAGFVPQAFQYSQVSGKGKNGDV